MIINLGGVRSIYHWVVFEVRLSLPTCDYPKSLHIYALLSGTRYTRPTNEDGVRQLR